VTVVASETRRTLVAAARKVWGERLVDLTRRNNLLYYRPLKLGSYDLDKSDPDALLDVLAQYRSAAAASSFVFRSAKNLGSAPGP
jgi:hypothetical protein